MARSASRLNTSRSSLLPIIDLAALVVSAKALPGAVRLALDPRAPVISRINPLFGDVRHDLTILTGINFLVGFGDTIMLAQIPSTGVIRTSGL